MFGIPRIVLFLGSLGLLPFVAGVLISSGGFYSDMGDTHQTALINLMWGYGGLALLDIFFFRQNLTPPWWLRFRIPLPLIVIICLSIGAHT